MAAVFQRSHTMVGAEDEQSTYGQNPEGFNNTSWMQQYLSEN